MVEAHYERRQEVERHEWERTRQIGAWIYNAAGKSFKENITGERLLPFSDEIADREANRLTSEERRTQAEETLMLHKSKAWMLYRMDERTGKVKIFDEEKLEEMRKRRREN